VDAGAYAAVRGFPLREAGEDFHLLAKLAKVGRIRSLEGAPIQLSDRISRRVPFGTGPALERAEANERAGDTYRLYHPASFDYLQSWLGVLNELAHCDAERRQELASPSALRSLAAASTSNRDAIDTELLIDALEATHSLSSVARACAGPPHHLHKAFDALRTLKLIHRLRDTALPNLELREALAQAPFVELPTGRASEVPLESLFEKLGATRPP
jgi:hypothetical protein